MKKGKYTHDYEFILPTHFVLFHLNTYRGCVPVLGMQRNLPAALFDDMFDDMSSAEDCDTSDYSETDDDEFITEAEERQKNIFILFCHSF